MKKSLIALAVLAASGAAMAQSSVTLYGVADAGVGKIKSQTYDPITGTLGGNNDRSDKTEFISGSTMNNGNSRLGVRGTEDLGGGLKAGFNFETGIDLDDGSATNSAFWARQANVWLGGNWGTLKLGRQFTPTYLAISTYELTGTANYSVLANTYNYGAIGSRANSAFAYVTPDMGGFSAAVAYVTKTDLGLSKAAYDLGLMYNNGPIAGGACSMRFARDLGAKAARCRAVVQRRDNTALACLAPVGTGPKPSKITLRFGFSSHGADPQRRRPHRAPRATGADRRTK